MRLSYQFHVLKQYDENGAVSVSKNSKKQDSVVMPDTVGGGDDLYGFSGPKSVNCGIFRENVTTSSFTSICVFFRNSAAFRDSFP